MTKEPGRGDLGPADSSGTVGDRGTGGTGVGVGVGGASGERGTVDGGGDRATSGVGVGDEVGRAVGDRGTVGVGVGGTLGDGGQDERTQLRAVMRDFGPAWEIERVPPGAAWVAVTRRGSWVHVIAAHDLDTLRTKIEAAELEETPPASAPSPTSPTS